MQDRPDGKNRGKRKGTSRADVSKLKSLPGRLLLGKAVVLLLGQSFCGILAATQHGIDLVPGQGS